MAPTRRIGTETSESRTALLDAALELMRDEGYAAVTSRRLAQRAGLKPQLVHYYFRSMDELFLALVRRGAEQNLVRLRAALASDRPLRALWALATDEGGVTLTLELMALGNHHKEIRAELAGYAEQFRVLQREALAPVLDGMPADAAAVVMTGLSQVLVLESALGVSTGHAELRALVERFLDDHEPA